MLPSEIGPEILAIADSTFKTWGYELDFFDLSYEGNERFYYVRYSPKRSLGEFGIDLGSYTELTISRQTKELIFAQMGSLSVPGGFYHGILDTIALELSKFEIVSDEVVDGNAIQIADSIARAEIELGLNRIIFESDDQYLFIYGSGPYPKDRNDTLYHPLEIVMKKKDNQVTYTGYLR